MFRPLYHLIVSTAELLRYPVGDCSLQKLGCLGTWACSPDYQFTIENFVEVACSLWLPRPAGHDPEEEAKTRTDNAEALLFMRKWGEEPSFFDPDLDEVAAQNSG
jgi:hypothetical protein